MFSKVELLDAIDELENSPATYQNAEKLATFYLLYDHLYIQKEPLQRIEPTREVTIDRYGDSDFLEAITDKKSEDIWRIMDELMATLEMLQPKLYRATIDQIKE